MPSAGARLESIDPNAYFITFSISDGDSSRWPTNTRPPPPNAREVNWLRKMTMEEKYVCRWRNLIGQGVAKLLEKPDKEKYCLQTFPDGYWMFDHNKGPISNIRHDLYLHGSKSVLRFRSPAEFIPHGYWILTDPTLNPQNCECKYCGGSGKRTQTEISQALGLPTNRGPTSVTGSPGMSGAVRQSIRLSRTDLSAAPCGPWIPKDKRTVSKIDSKWKIKSLESNLVANSTRTSDLRSNRMFRLGELVWFPWNVGESYAIKEKDVQIPRLWPAVVIDCILNISAGPLPPSGMEESHCSIHRREYVLRRLGPKFSDPSGDYEFTKAEHEILPWYAHKMGSRSVLSSISTTSRTDDGLYSFAFALRIAENLLCFWAVCDRLPTKVSMNKRIQGLRIDSKRVDIHCASLRSTPLSVNNTVEATPPQRSPARLVPTSAARARIPSNASHGRMPASSGTNIDFLLSKRVHETQPRDARVTETRYQGIWYGPERIWTGDLVRLSPERRAFIQCLELCSKSSGDDILRQRINSSHGTDTRGVLMKIHKIFTRLSDAGTKECAASGPLYEVAPAGWEDPATQSTSSMTSRQQDTQMSPPSHDQIYPWNMTDKQPLRRDKGQSKQSHLLYIPPNPVSEAPVGYTLRPLLPKGLEIPLPVSFIAGRYYPEILKSSLLTPTLSNISIQMRTFDDFASADWNAVELLSLSGLAPGRYNSAVCTEVKLASRTGMLQEAIREAKAQFQGDAMDVDFVW